MATIIRQEERFNFRLSKDNKELLERAASLEGKNLKDFVQGAALREAQRVLMERTVIRMANEERDAFLALLDTDPEPTPEAFAAAAAYHSWRSNSARSDPPG